MSPSNDRGTKVEVWQLVVSIMALAVTFGTIVYLQSRQQAMMEEQIRTLIQYNANQDSVTAYVRRRQEINEDRISKLETEAALTTAFQDRMVREHADIYNEIRKSRK